MEEIDNIIVKIERKIEMKVHHYALFFFILGLSTVSISQEYQSFFPPEEFKARWEKVFDKIGDNAIAIITR